MPQMKKPSPETFKVSWKEKAQLKAEADAEGLTKSSYIRLLVFGGKPETRTMRRPTPERGLIERMIGAVGRVGNNMNQIAHKLNSGMALGGFDIRVLLKGIEAIEEIRLILIDFLRRG